MHGPNKKNTRDPRFKHLDMETVNAVSATDFTGIIPTEPQSEEEREAYKDIHGFGTE